MNRPHPSSHSRASAGRAVSRPALGDFALVRHVRLGGSQRDIDHQIAEFAWANHGVRPQPSRDPALTGVQVVTNHLLMRYPTVDGLPAGDGGAGRTFAQFRALTAMFSDRPRYAPEEVTSRHATIRFAGPDIPVRTLWHVLYEPAATAMTVSFHVRDGRSGEVRSPQMRFSLASGVRAEPGSAPLTAP